MVLFSCIVISSGIQNSYCLSLVYVCVFTFAYNKDTTHPYMKMLLLFMVVAIHIKNTKYKMHKPLSVCVL